MTLDMVVRNGRVVFPGRGVFEADIGIGDGRIAAILRPGEVVGDVGQEIDASGLVVSPGIIDAHLHWGLADPLEQYVTETRYAAEGGVTSTVGYITAAEPYIDILGRELDAARDRAYVDYGFHLTIATDEQMAELPRYVDEYGISSFKFFMNYKGEVGLYMGVPGSDDGFLYELMQNVAEFGRALLVVHPENIELVLRIRRHYQEAGKEGLWEWRQSKPPIIQAENALRAMYFAEHTGCPIYFPHVTSRMTVDEVRRYRQRYDRVQVEACPIYLTHTADMDIGTIGKGNPALETQDNVDAMWHAVADGTVDVIATDHVPRKRATKDKGWWEASQGWPGTGVMVPAILNEGYHKRGVSLQRLIELMTILPARTFGMVDRKGDIAVGLDADLTLIDLDMEKVVRWQDFSSNSDYTPYEGMNLKGWPVMTIVRGTVVMRGGKITGDAGHGQYLKRTFQD